MKLKNKSIFNLIEIFRKGHQPALSTIHIEKHCGEKHHHDFYCDAEKPFTPFKN